MPCPPPRSPATSAPTPGALPLPRPPAGCARRPVPRCPAFLAWSAKSWRTRSRPYWRPAPLFLPRPDPARQLLAVNLFTDLAPAMAIALQPPSAGRIDLAREGPDTSLAGPLARDVAIRAGATAVGAYGAWLAARFTGTPTRARTVALAALVFTQLGQTLITGRRSPLVAGAALGSTAGLAAIIQTPGLSQFFECRPLGPLGWSLALGSATIATGAGALAAKWLTVPVSPDNGNGDGTLTAAVARQ
jgi:hypothetical protein